MAIAQDRPKFRTDLVAQSLELSGQRFVDVTDPESEQTFRFYEVEYAIASAMDGQRDIPGLLRWANEELGLDSDRDELTTVVNTLADLGYLDGANGVSDDIELGAPGLSPAAMSAPTPGADAAHDDVELGASGGSPKSRAPTPEGGAGDFELGDSGGTAPAARSDEQSFAGLMEEGELGPAGGSGRESPSNGRQSMSAVPLPLDEEPLPPPPAPVIRHDSQDDVAPMLSPTTTGDEEEDTQLPAPEPPSYDDDDVSVDLSDHLSLGADDVKEAVRQSKVMQAVEIPADLAQEFGGAPAVPVAAPAAAPEPAPAAPPQAYNYDEPPADDQQAAPDPFAATGFDMAAPVEPVEPIDQPRQSPAVLWALVGLLLAIAGGGAYYYFVLLPAQQGAAAPTSEVTPPQPVPQPEAMTPEPSDPEPTLPQAVLVEHSVAGAEVQASGSGLIDWVAASGEKVAEGDVVARLDGARRIEAAKRRYEARLAHYERKLAAAISDGDSAKLSAYESKVAEKKGLVEAEAKKLAALVMSAPEAGVVEPIVSPGARVKKGAPVVRIVGQKSLRAEFSSGGDKLAAGGECTVALSSNKTVKPPCEVVEVAESSFTVRIPIGAGAAAGDQVVLVQP